MTETPMKPDQPRPSEPTQKGEVPTGPELPTSPRTRMAGITPAPKEVPVNTIVEEVVRELEEEKR